MEIQGIPAENPESMHTFSRVPARSGHVRQIDDSIFSGLPLNRLHVVDLVLYAYRYYGEPPLVSLLCVQA